MGDTQRERERETHTQTHTHTDIVGYKNDPLCTRICPYPFFEATPPGAAPGPPVKTGARVRHFRGCKNPTCGGFYSGECQGPP